MAVDEEIFEKEVDKVVKKPKRKLTEAQLANLAKGRAKMAEKRRLAKEAKEKAKAEGKEEVKGEKEHIKTKKTNVKAKRKTLKEINKEKEQSILAKLEKQEAEKTAKRQTREDLFHSLKVKCLEQAKTVNEYQEIKVALDGIDEDTLHDDNKLKAYAKKVMKPYVKERKEKKKVVLEPIEETNEVVEKE